MPFGNIGTIEWDQNGPGQEPLGTIFHVLIVPHGGTSTPSCYVYGPTLTLSYPKTCRSPYGMHLSTRLDGRRNTGRTIPPPHLVNTQAWPYSAARSRGERGATSGHRARTICSGPDREVGLNRGAVFLLVCVLAVVGGGAIPGPAGTILLVLGILIALAVAAAWFFRTADSWAEGAGTGESRRRSGPTGPVELPSATVNLIGQRHKRNALARRHLAPHRNPKLQTQQAAGARKKSRAAQSPATGVGSVRWQLLSSLLLASPRSGVTAAGQASHPPRRP